MGEGLEQHKSDVSITAADEIRSGLKGGDGGPEPLPQMNHLHIFHLHNVDLVDSPSSV